MQEVDSAKPTALCELDQSIPRSGGVIILCIIYSSRSLSIYSFASRGANVCINDFSKEAADKAVKEINDKSGGRAIANYDNVLEGGKIVQQAFDKWGRVDILINK